MTKIIEIVPAISEEASGPSYSVKRLCEAVIAAGSEVTLAALDWAPLISHPSYLKTFPLGIGSRRLGRSPIMKNWLAQKAQGGDIDLIHNHGMWQMNAVYPGQVATKYEIPYIISPRGTFSTHAFSQGSILKKAFWPLLQKPSFSNLQLLHATAQHEYSDIRRMGFKQPVAIIPNGIDVPPLRQKQHTTYRTLLFLGRIHSIKGLDILLPAWQAVQDRFPDWQLRIVGDDAGFHASSGYLIKMQKLSEKLKLKRITFSGAIYGDDKWQAYTDADLFVLPTYSENFGISVAESLAAGTPVICSKGAPWEGLDTHGAGRWIDIGLDSLVAALESLMTSSPEYLETMGQRGRNWMLQDYSWTQIGQQMAEVYDWLLDPKSTPPTCIMIN